MKEKRTDVAEEKRNILRRRARVLSGAKTVPEKTSSILEALVFLLSYERYALETTCVREVHPLRNVTRIPFTPPLFLGVMNVRGQILAIVDLKQFFGLPPKGLTEFNRVIRIGEGDLEIGIVVDEILGIQRIPRERIGTPPTLPHGTLKSFILGITAEQMILLDGHRIFEDRRIVALETPSLPC